MTVVAQPSFTTGELAPSLYARVDLARYYTGLKTCRNFIVRPYGGVMNRAGTRFCAEVKDSAKKVRLIEFIFSTSQAFVLELGEQYIRFHANGGAVLDDEDEILEVATPYLEADLPFLKFVQSADVVTICHPSYPVQQLSRLSNTSWTLAAFHNLEGPFQELNIDTAKTVYASAYTGSVTIHAASGIFAPEMVGQMLLIEQAPDSLTNKWEVQKGIVINDKRRAGANYYEAVNSGTTGTVRPSILEGVESDGDPGVTWRYLHSGSGIVLITGYVDTDEVTGTVLKRLPDSVVTGSLSRTITGVVAGTEPVEGGEGAPDTPGVNARVTCPAHGFSTGDSVTISGVTGMTGINVAAQIIVFDANTYDLSGVYGSGEYAGGGTAIKTLEGTNTYKWALEAWGGDQGYPATTIYYQQRQVFGGPVAQPHNVYMSTSGGFTSFIRSNPLLDDDAVIFKLVSKRMNEIRHFVEIGDLIALTSEGPWVIKKEQGSPNPDVRFQGRGGASHVPPVVVGEDALFVTAQGGAIRSLGYFFQSDKYQGKDLTMTGSHLLFGKEVKEWAYQETPFSTVWMVRDDGVLLGLTYLPYQEVIGWHRHDTDGVFESVCCIPEGKEDAVYAVVRREVNGVQKRYIERFASRFFTDIEDAYFVDCGLSYDGRLAGAGVSFTLSGGDTWSHEETLTFETATDFFTGISDQGDAIVLHDSTGEALRLSILEYVSPTEVQVLAHRTVPAELRGEGVGFQVARDTFTGMGHLEGKTVSILAAGNVEAQKVVTGGSFQLENPSVVVHAGLPIEADFETLDLNVQGQSLQDKVKNIRSVTFIVEKTRGLWAGPDPDHLLELSPKTSWEYDKPVAEETGPMKANVISDWSEGGRVFVRQSDPLPATILAALPEVQVGGA
jgi:hypothetical protein